MSTPACVFCGIECRDVSSSMVYEDEDCFAFLDSHPLFPGHVLLSPRGHYETLLDLPPEKAGLLMIRTQMMAQAVETALEAEGTFIAINNKVSQSVPHLHIHVVPRRRRDGLKGFFWPRHKYQDEKARETVRAAIEREIRRLQS